MSEENKDSGPMTDRLLIIAGAIAVLAAVAVYYFHGEYQATLEELETAKQNYERMKKMGVKVVRLHGIEKERGTASNTQNPTTYLGQIFANRGFDRGRYSVTTLRETPLEGWKEKPFVVDFPVKSKDPLERTRFIDTLSFIERQRPDIKSKDLTLRYKEGELEGAKITFTSYVRE